VTSFHLDTDVLVYACARGGPERVQLLELLEAGAPIAMSAWAWYEFRRGPRTPEQLAAASMLLGEGGIVPLSGDIAETAAEIFRSLGSPRRRAADIVIGATAKVCEATLLSRNAGDFVGIVGLDLRVVGS
jgi:predicted nucleic acid-binding protein